MGFVVSNGGITKNDKFERMLNEVVLAYFKYWILQHLLE